MKNILYLIVCLFFLISTSCKKPVISTTYEDGSTFEVYEYKGDSLKHGMYKAYLENGDLVEEAHYLEGKLDGKRKIYKGKSVEIEEFYENNVMNGTYKVFYPDGTVKLERPYNHGILEGMVKGYYPSGAIKEEVTFVDNMEQGPFREFHENGQVMWEGSYLNGDNEFGLLKQFDDQGELIKKMMCNEEGVCTTTWTKADGEITQ